MISAGVAVIRICSEEVNEIERGVPSNPSKVCMFNPTTPDSNSISAIDRSMDIAIQTGTPDLQTISDQDEPLPPIQDKTWSLSIIPIPSSADATKHTNGSGRQSHTRYC